jgi:hypothetical protein
LFFCANFLFFSPSATFHSGLYPKEIQGQQPPLFAKSCSSFVSPRVVALFLAELPAAVDEKKLDIFAKMITLINAFAPYHDMIWAIWFRKLHFTSGAYLI